MLHIVGDLNVKRECLRFHFLLNGRNELKRISCLREAVKKILRGDPKILPYPPK